MNTEFKIDKTELEYIQDLINRYKYRVDFELALFRSLKIYSKVNNNKTYDNFIFFIKEKYFKIS